MENHHEDPKPTNKWIATPIVAAFIVIALVVTFIKASSGQFSKSSKSRVNEHGTEQHDATHEEKDDDEHLTKDTTAAVTDSSEAAEENEEHKGH